MVSGLTSKPQTGHLVRDYVELTKPRITWLILMSTAIGYFFGLSRASGWRALLGTIVFVSLVHTIVGTSLIASGTAALNQWYERDADRRMRRTARRPLPAGRLSAERALAFGVTLSIAGFVELWLGVNLLSGVIGAFTLASYLFLYTPLKQRTWWSTTVGAIPGAMPPVIGYAAAAGAVSREAWVLGAILFLWQFPHFYSIAWMYKEDYARAGIRMLLGLWFLYSGVRVALDRNILRARSVLMTSVLYLPLIYGLMILDRPGL